MAIYSKEQLENKVGIINDWLQHHHQGHHLYQQKISERNYYVDKLTEMDDYNLEKISI